MAGVNYISGFQVGDAYYSGAEYGGSAVLTLDAVAPAFDKGLSLAHDLAQANNLPQGSVVPQAYITVDSVDFGDTDGTNAVAATGTLTASGQPSDGQTVTIGYQNGVRVYTWKTAIVNAYDVLIGGNTAASLANLRDAINRGATEGTDYGRNTAAHPQVTATADATHVYLTAIIPGARGNLIATTENSSNMSWGAATLVSGADAIPS